MRITESRLRRIIKEELDAHDKSYLARGLEDLYNRTNMGTLNTESDSAKLKQVSDSLIDLIQLSERTIAK